MNIPMLAGTYPNALLMLIRTIGAQFEAGNGIEAGAKCVVLWNGKAVRYVRLDVTAQSAVS